MIEYVLRDSDGKGSTRSVVDEGWRSGGGREALTCACAHGYTGASLRGVETGRGRRCRACCALSSPDRWRWTCGRGRRAADSPRQFQFQTWWKRGTAVWTQSSFVHDADILVPYHETSVASITSAAAGLVRAGQTGYAPVHGPGAGTSGCSSTLVSKSVKPRRR